ncbi:MAG: ribokinase [Halobacteriales archaeon]
MTDDTAEVAVVGSYNVGLTMIVPRFPVGGETVIGRDFAEGPGGKGSNQAIAAARLGADTSFIGNVGTDRYGDDALDLWESESVDATNVRRSDDSHTGVGFVIVDEDGENEITVAPGANDALDPAAIRNASPAIEGSDCLLAQLEVPNEPLEAAADIAAHADVPLILNPAPARELPASLLENVTYLTPNESEALILTGREPDADVDHADLGRELLDLGVDTVVMTRGDSGALLVTDEELTTVEAPEVPVTDTTGAGDAFNGAFAVALGEGMAVEDAVRFACRAGALAVTEKEVIPGLPHREAVETMADEPS